MKVRGHRYKCRRDKQTGDTKQNVYVKMAARQLRTSENLLNIYKYSIMMSVILLNVILLNVILMDVILLNVILLNVIPRALLW